MKQSVHPYVTLDYEHNCSCICNPKTNLPFCSCLTEAGERNVMQEMGLSCFDVSDDAYCEWAYFWMDREAEHYE